MSGGFFAVLAWVTFGLSVLAAHGRDFGASGRLISVAAFMMAVAVYIRIGERKP